MTRRRRRAGFTLVELMVALVITGIVALTSYAALAAGTSTRSRVDGELRTRASALVARALLDDALRHAIDASDVETRIADDALTFVTRGVREPLGGSTRWRVRVQPRATDDLSLVAEPLDADGAMLTATLAGARRLRVRVLGPNGWQVPNDATRLPDAVRVEFLDADGRPAAALPPIVARPNDGGLR